MTDDEPDPLAAFRQADRTYQAALAELETLGRVRDEAMLDASVGKSVAALSAETDVPTGEIRRMLARARSARDEES